MSENSNLRARREGLQRIQAGMVGLLGVLLVVGLANIMIKNARQDDGIASAVGAAAGGSGGGGNAAAPNPNEPLADLGVTPTSETATGSSVPDLKPDPRLSKRMDRDPEAAQGGR